MSRLQSLTRVWTVAAVLASGQMVTAALAADVLPAAVKAKVHGELVWHDGSGGLTTRARDGSTNKDFTAETGVKLTADYNADLTKFFAAMESGASIPWSMVEFSTEGDFIRARDQGYLEKLDPAIVDLSKVGAGSHDQYGVDVLRYGIVFTYNTDSFKGGTPQGIRDLFDTKRFPGKRCLFKYPQFGGVLESALLADGVKRDALYPLDLDRAFKKLDTIKSDILWWSNGDDAVRLLSSGECSMGIAWSGRAYGAIKNDQAHLAVAWPDSLYSQAVYAVPKGAPNPVAGQALIAHFISDIEGQKALVGMIPYTTDIVGIDAASYGKDLQPWIVAGANAGAAIKENAPYYAGHLSEVVDRFNRWVATK